MDGMIGTTSVPLKPAVLESIVSLIEERTAPRPQESREYTLTVLLLGVDDDKKTELMNLLREYFQVKQGEKNNDKGNSVTVSSLIDGKQLCLKIVSVPEKSINKIHKEYPLTSACVFVCDITSQASIEFLKEHLEAVTLKLKEEAIRLQTLYNTTLLAGNQDPSGGLTLDSVKRAMTAPHFVPHILVVCNVGSFADQNLKSDLRRFVFDKELRWVETPAFSESTVRSILCLARGVADDYDFIEGPSWDKMQNSADKQNGCCIM